MSSVAANLIANEHVVFASGKHWMALVRESLIAAGLVLAGLVLWRITPSAEGDPGLLGILWTLLALVRWALLLAGAGWIAHNVIVWRTAEFAVTNLRVLRYEGLLQKRSSETMLRAVSDVKLDVGFIGERLGYGDIRIFTQSGDAGADVFGSISHPAEFRSAMLLSQRVEDEMTAHGPATPATPVAAPAPAPAPAPAVPPAPWPAPRPPAAQSVGPSSAEDQAARLVKLAELRDQGVITAEEFEAKKAEILARM